VLTGEQSKSNAKTAQYQTVFGQALIAEARKDDKIVAITAAMPSGTGIDLFGKEFPARTFDVALPSSTRSRSRLASRRTA